MNDEYEIISSEAAVSCFKNLPGYLLVQCLTKLQDHHKSEQMTHGLVEGTVPVYVWREAQNILQVLIHMKFLRCETT
jgi:hypothetical protein